MHKNGNRKVKSYFEYEKVSQNGVYLHF